MNVLLDSKNKDYVLGVVLSSQLVLLDLQSSLKDLLGLGTSDSAMNCNLLVSSNPKAPDGVTGLGEDWCLSRERLQHLASSGQSVSRFSNTDVETQLPDLQVPHHVLALVLVTTHLFDLLSLVEVNQAILAW